MIREKLVDEWPANVRELAGSWEDFPTLEEIRDNETARRYSGSAVMWVLDTNTLIYFFRGEGNVAKEILSRSPSAIGIPSIVLYELEVGIAKSTSPRKRLGQLEQLTAVVQTLPFGAGDRILGKLDPDRRSINQHGIAQATRRKRFSLAGASLNRHSTCLASPSSLIQQIRSRRR